MAKVDALMRLMMKDRMSASKFDFDALKAPPLSSLLSQRSLYDLRSIAVDPRLASKPKERRQYIRSILGQYGFIENGAGTNRICYRHCDVSSIILKVAVTKSALTDSPNEFINQRILKPFVSKCFEHSVCGTVGLFEKVDPIKSREQFYEIAPDVFEFLTTFMDGEYIMEDVGTNYYLNYGIRHGFGPVLLDYPYLFKIDSKKLKCWRPDPNSPTGTCDGDLDQDPGFNNIICTKCGKMYIAKDLRKIEKPMFYINNKNEGELNMKIALVRGNNVELEAQIGKETIQKTVKAPIKNLNNMMNAVNTMFDEDDSHQPPVECVPNLKEEYFRHITEANYPLYIPPELRTPCRGLSDNLVKAMDRLYKTMSENCNIQEPIDTDIVTDTCESEPIVDNLKNVSEYRESRDRFLNSLSMNDIPEVNPMFQKPSPTLQLEEQPNSVTTYSEESVTNTMKEDNEMSTDNVMKGNDPDEAKDADVRFVTGYEEDECEEVEEPESDTSNEKDPYLEETSDIDDEY